jgi:hypothetical protein
VQTKGIEHILLQIIAETSQVLENRWSSRYRRLLEQQTDKTRKEPLHTTSYRTRKEYQKWQERNTKSHIKANPSE